MHIFPQCSLAFELGTKSIKFLQNICESHNQFFQNKLFQTSLNERLCVYDHAEFYPANANEKDSPKRNTVNFQNKRERQLTTRESLVNRGNSLKITSKEKTFRLKSLDLTMSKSTGHSEAKHGDYYDKKIKIEEEEKQKLKNQKFTLVNFYLLNMRLILNNINANQNTLLYQNEELCNIKYTQELYQRLNDLIVEIIQGTKSINFDAIYRKLPDAFKYNKQ